jgi:hypothetical protein
MNMKIKFPAKSEFVKWLRAKPDDETFRYADPKSCLFAQFLNHSYPDKKFSLGPWTYRLIEGEIFPLPKWAQTISDKIADGDGDGKREIFSFGFVKTLIK